MGFGRQVGRLGAALLLSVALGFGIPGCSKKKAKPKANRAQTASMDRSAMVPVGGPARTRPLPPRPASLAGTAAELYTRARSAWLAGECADAVRFAQAANRRKSSSRHTSIIGACACTLRRRALAQWAYRNLRGGNRTMLINVCRSKGIELGDPVADRTPASDMEPVDPVERDAKSATGLYQQARTAWLSGQCSRAIRLAQKANKLKFSTRHLSIIGACACSLRRVALAKRTYRHLRGGNRTMLINVCRSKGIVLK